MLELERAAAGLNTACQTLQKLMALSGVSEGRRSSFHSLVQQWGKLQVLVGKAHEFCMSRGRDLEAREKEVDDKEKALGNLQTMLLSAEISLSKKLKELEKIQEGVKKWIEFIDMSKKRIFENDKRIELEERRICRIFGELESKESQFNERLKAFEEGKIGDLFAELEFKESQLNERLKALKEGKIGDLFAELESKESQMNERLKALEEREKAVKEREEEIDKAKNKRGMNVESLKRKLGKERESESQVGDDGGSESSRCDVNEAHEGGRKRRRTIQTTELVTEEECQDTKQ